MMPEPHGSWSDVFELREIARLAFVGKGLVKCRPQVWLVHTARHWLQGCIDVQNIPAYQNTSNSARPLLSAILCHSRMGTRQ
jgi:hypothetical protein